VSNYVVESRASTCEILKTMVEHGERIIISRYSDGEANIFRGRKGIDLKCGNEDSTIVRDLLLKSIKNSGQMVCINELKKSNIKKNDRWVKVQKELAEIGGHKVYGGANWNTYDFQGENKILPYLFSGNVLIVTGHAEDARKAFESKNIKLNYYETSLKAASKYYSEYLEDLRGMVKENRYDNILFSCGPIGKVLLVDMIGECESNLVDTGCLINAIIDSYLYSDRRTIKSWNMNWTDGVDIHKCANKMIGRINASN